MSTPWDTVHAAWRASHPSHPPLPPPADHACARCASAGGQVAVREVVSKKFTAWDSWADPQAALLCTACAWGYRTRDLRADALMIVWDDAEPACRRVDAHELAAALEGPLPAHVALSVPLRAGRRHVLPVTEFGRVCVDGTNVTWSVGDARRLGLVQQLRRQGVPWRSFTEPTPSWRAVSSSPDPQAMLQAWDELRAWRASGVWLQVALAATHPVRSRAA